MSVKIYTTNSCHWCHAAKEFFKENKIQFSEINVEDDEDAQVEMIEKSGQLGVPVIEINNKIIVGFNRPAIISALGMTN